MNAIGILAITLLAAPAVALPPADVAASTRAFHAQRLERLRAPDGWLTLVGLLWLKEGENRVGSSAGSQLVLPPNWPAELGIFGKQGAQLSFVPQAGVPVTLGGKAFPGGAVSVEGEGESEPFLIGALRLTVIRRGDRVGLRLRDPGSEVRAHLKDVPMYPPSAAWRVTATFEPAPPGHTLSMKNVLGMEQPSPSPGTAVFEIAGKVYRLAPIIDEPGHLFFVFGDATNGDTTYGAGRFLNADMPKDGKVVLDFNQAVNPPCAFTPFATCPIPPKENRLPFRVEAGELKTH